MIECPTCKHQEFVGTLYCGECGTRLVHGASVPTMEVSRGHVEPGEGTVTKPGAQEGPELESGAILGLRVVSTGTVLSLIGRENYTLGRLVPTQAVIPDVDLSPFRAHEHGVSRMHAEIRLDYNGVHVIDLESANGTHINGQRLEPQVLTPVRHGDIIQLGSLSLQLISRYRV
ncbi:MAG TPA: FHA domain-containing protein [Anaerolineales bacterium]|nr:FHA domain-containing protein [Anaerolineales bacterium]